MRYVWEGWGGEEAPGGLPGYVNAKGGRGGGRGERATRRTGYAGGNQPMNPDHPASTIKPIKFTPPSLACALAIRFGTLFSVSGNACVRLRRKNLAAWLLNAARSGRHAVSSAALGAGHLALGRHLMALALQPHQQPSMPPMLAAAERGSTEASLLSPPSLITADERTRAYALRYAMQHLSLAVALSAVEESGIGVTGSGGSAQKQSDEAGRLLMSGVASWELIGRVFVAGYGVDAVRALDRAVRLLGSPPPRSLPLPPRTAGGIACNDEEKQPASTAPHPSAPAAAAGISSDDYCGANSSNDEDGDFYAYLCEALRWLRLCFDEFEARPTELEATTLRLCPVR